MIGKKEQACKVQFMFKCSLSQTQLKGLSIWCYVVCLASCEYQDRTLLKRISLVPAMLGFNVLLPSGSEEHEVLWAGSIQEGILHAPHFR